jgi:hypothetical protein
MDIVDMAIHSVFFVKNLTFMEIVTFKIPSQIPAKNSGQNVLAF